MANNELEKDEMFRVTLILMRDGTLRTNTVRSSEVVQGTHSTLVSGLLARAQTHLLLIENTGRNKGGSDADSK